MKTILLMLCCGLMCCGCTTLSGGATYHYKLQNAEGKSVELEVHTNRQVADQLQFKMNPETGEVKVKTGGISSGPDETSKIIEAVVKAVISAMGAAK